MAAAESSGSAEPDKVAAAYASGPAPGVIDELLVVVEHRQLLQPLLAEPFLFAAHMHVADPVSMP